MWPWDFFGDAPKTPKECEDWLKKIGDQLATHMPNSNLHVFPKVYAIITASLIKALQTPGAFKRNDWVAALIVGFVGLYFNALQGFLATRFPGGKGGVKCPDAWSDAFESSSTGKNYVVQDLFLAMNAHINRDLAHTVADGLNAFLSKEKLEVLYEDFDKRINAELKNDIKEVKNEIKRISGIWMTITDWLFGGWGDELAGAAMEIARAGAWLSGLMLSDASLGKHSGTISLRFEEYATLIVKALVSATEFERLEKIRKRRLAETHLRVHCYFANRITGGAAFV